MRRAATGLTDDGLRAAFVSPNVADSNLEPANVVDVIDKLAYRVGRVANAITPAGAAPGRDSHGGGAAWLAEVHAAGRVEQVTAARGSAPPWRRAGPYRCWCWPAPPSTCSAAARVLGEHAARLCGGRG
jgi:hypothetical protein